MSLRNDVLMSNVTYCIRISHFFRKDELDHAATLERAANTALSLVQDLHTSSEQVSNLSSAQKATDLPSLKTPLDHDTERAQFVMKLAPRIRKLESDTSQCLSLRLEAALKQIQRQCDEGTYINDDQDAGNKVNHHEVSTEII